MKRLLVSVVLLVGFPAFATISQVRSAATWNVSASSTCAVSLSATNNNDLMVLWTYWRTSGTNNLTVSSITHTLGSSFSSAVGPTLQSASNTAGQIFYIPNIAGGGADFITVTFSGSASVSSGCVAVEYSGLDQNYPLDSVSAGYSYSPGSLLDSGTAAPANANLLLFGGGNWSGGSLIAGINFTSIQASGGSITEQEIVSGNNTLQRATAIPNPNGNAPGTAGNWLMQMAVFRDASWTVSGGWSPVRAAQVRNADQFPGADASYKVNACIADVLTAGGGTCDARGLGGTQSGLSQEIDVGNGTLGVDLILPSNATWSWNPVVNNGTICGIKVFNSGAVYSNGDSSQGSRTILTVTSSSANMRAILCTNSAVNGYEHMRGIYVTNISYDGQGGTMAYGDIDIENVGDASSFDDLSCVDNVANNNCFYVSGLSYQARIFHCVADGVTVDGTSNSQPILITGPFNNVAGIIDGCTANRPPKGSANIKILGSGGDPEGVTIIQPYMESNTSSSDSTGSVGMIDIASTAFNITIVGGTAVSTVVGGGSTRPAISTGSTRTSVTGMQALNFNSVPPLGYSGGIRDSQYGVNIPSKPLCCTNEAAVPTYDSASNSAQRYVAVDLTLQTMAQGTTTLYTVLPNASSVASGQYRLSWNAKVTTPGGSSSTLGGMTVTYYDPDGMKQTIAAAATNRAGAVETADSGNTTTTAMLGIPLLLNCLPNTAITYAFGYTSSGSPSMKYNLHIQLEAMPH